MSLSLRALLLGAWVLLAGCPGEAGSFCELDEQCAEGLACFAGTCQELGDPAGQVVYEVVPATGTGLGSATFAMGEQPLAFDFCGPSLVRGAVDGAAEVAIEGSPAGLEGQVRHFREQVRGAFRLPLPPGDWRLTFLLEPSLPDGLPPPPERREVQLSRCQAVSIGFVEPTAEARVATFAVVVDPWRDPRPRCGLAAQLADPSTGTALSQAIYLEQESGRACLTPGLGWELPFSPPAEGEEIELRLAPLGSLPTLAHQAIRLPLPAGDRIDLGTVGIGAEVAVERVVVRVVDPQGAAVGDAAVRARRLPGADGARFEPPLALPLAGEPGAYELWLLPGTYRIEAAPPPGLQAATSRCIEPEGGGACDEVVQVAAGRPLQLLAKLPEPLRLEGRLYSAEREPLARARVRAIPLGAGRLAEAVSGGDGRYQLLLDPGSYELLVQAREADAAWRRQPLTEFNEDDNLNLLLPRAARVVGSVTTTAKGRAKALHQALVRAWRVDGEGPPVLVGETLTDAEGRFGLALPAAN